MDRLTVDAVDPTEFCHGFDLSKWEEDMSLFSSVVIVHVDSDSFRKESDLSSAFVCFPLLERICRGTYYTGCCGNPRAECGCILAIHYVLGASSNGAVFSSSLPSSLQQLRSSRTPLGGAERNESSSLRELHRPSSALARYSAERRINARRHAAD